MTIIIGIDPGLSGAIVIDNDGEIEVLDMPTVEVMRSNKKKRELNLAALSTILYGVSQRIGNVRAFVEQVGAMPGQGTSSMFSFGKSYGATLGILAAFEIPVTHVTPQRWQKALQVRGGKDGSRLRASELMPSAAHFWPLVKHDGRAEAALIGYYGKMTLK